MISAFSSSTRICTSLRQQKKKGEKGKEASTPDGKHHTHNLIIKTSDQGDLIIDDNCTGVAR
jgi:hypothetical protein